MMTEIERIKESIRLDNKYQHIKYYQEGYRECVLTLRHGEDKVWDRMQIDVGRYAPDSARKISYEEGWNDAINDYEKKINTTGTTATHKKRTMSDIDDIYSSLIDSIYAKYHVNPFTDLFKHNEGIHKAMIEFAIFYKNNSTQ